MAIAVIDASGLSDGDDSKNDGIFLLITIADCPLMGQFASKLNFYDNSGRSPLADWKPLLRHFSLQ
jgi:hypothetical protein